jgi:hypothetical protein
LGRGWKDSVAEIAKTPASKPNTGLADWLGARIKKADSAIGEPRLGKEEQDALNLVAAILPV